MIHIPNQQLRNNPIEIYIVHISWICSFIQFCSAPISDHANCITPGLTDTKRKLCQNAKSKKKNTDFSGNFKSKSKMAKSKCSNTWWIKPGFIASKTSHLYVSRIKFHDIDNVWTKQTDIISKHVKNKGKRLFWTRIMQDYYHQPTDTRLNI